MAKFLIAAPANEEMVTTAYVISLLNLGDHLKARSIETVQFFLTSSLLPRMRNAYASIVLSRPPPTRSAGNGL